MEDFSGFCIPDVDLAGNPRVFNDRIDMGAYEFGSTVSIVDPVELTVTKSMNLWNYPNPFNPETVIKWTVDGERLTDVIARSEATKQTRQQSTVNSQHITINIYNIRGQLVRKLVDDIYAPGEHSVVWNGTDDAGRSVGSGVYLYQMKTDDLVQTRKMILIK